MPKEVEKKKKRWSYSENGFYQFLADLVYGPIFSITLTKSSKNSKFNTYCSCVVRWHESMTTPDIIPGSPGHMVRIFLDGIEREKGSGFSKPSHPSRTTGAVHPDRGWSQWGPSLVLPHSGCSRPQWCRSWVLLIMKFSIKWGDDFLKCVFGNVIFTIFVMNKDGVSLYYRLSFNVNI